MTLISSLVPLMVPCGMMLNNDNYYRTLCFELLLSTAAVAHGVCLFSLRLVCKASLQRLADYFLLNFVTIIWVGVTDEHRVWHCRSNSSGFAQSWKTRRAQLNTQPSPERWSLEMPFIPTVYPINTVPFKHLRLSSVKPCFVPGALPVAEDI